MHLPPSSESLVAPARRSAGAGLAYQMDDALTADSGRVFLSGTQALVRLLLAQRRADQARGLRTAGFVTGYRGSPLGGVDQALWRAQALLDAHQVRFQPAINEDLAATMLAGTQQVGDRADRRVDGVFGLWYGKGPGVDRAGDALHHGHAAGASRQGGVLLVVGDDHAAASSSIPHASENVLSAWRIPVIHPASIADYEAWGLWGWALSRYSGAWVALKAITETVESSRGLWLPPCPPTSPEPPDGPDLSYSTREFLTPAIEDRMLARLEAVRAFARLHPLDRLLDPAPQATVGIISVGKASLDVVQALARLRREHLQGLPPLRHLQVGLIWPLETDGVRRFAAGLSQVLVVEEKTTCVESQVREALGSMAQPPRVVGRRDGDETTLVPGVGQLSPSWMAGVLARWLALPHAPEQDWRGDQAIVLAARSVRRPGASAAGASAPQRRPYFCAGCPHNTSTRLPAGSQARGGVGCHYMATWMERDTAGLTQMGGEGVDWLGAAPFVDSPHVFQNMGEGTYFHSGLLAIRQAVAAGARVTYKILYNDAVAMTGGQPVDGRLNVPDLCQQLRGEGVVRIDITTDDPARYRGVALPQGVSVHPRAALDAVQRTLRETPGVTVLIHDQACAAEKRRRRRRGLMPAAPRRLSIHPEVCEGCGDCGRQSNCLSLMPLETPFGRKRAIDQSSCNQDESCLDGFCPSFVSVTGGRPRQRAMAAEALAHLLDEASALPVPDTAARASNLIVSGIGGTGVVTVGAIVAMAAHLEGRGVSVLDVTGLAQKGGMVTCHVRLSADGEPVAAVRVDDAGADAALLCDPLAAVAPATQRLLRPGYTGVTLNHYLAPVDSFTRDPDVANDAGPLVSQLVQFVGEQQVAGLDAHALALACCGDALMSNMLLLGHAWQRGLLPVGEAALMRAIELNGVAVQGNQQAFQLGRLAAVRPARFEQTAAPAQVPLDEQDYATLVAQRIEALHGYQDAAYARRYQHVVARVAQAEAALAPGVPPRLARAVALSLHRLMAYKDEYEVARLLTDPAFERSLRDTFDGEIDVSYHLAAPLLSRRDPDTGRLVKRRYGPAWRPWMRLLRHGKWLRGGWLDPFGYTAERRRERRLWREYEAMVLRMVLEISAANLAQAIEWAELPLAVRGYGHVKQASMDVYEARCAVLWARWTGEAAPMEAAVATPA